MADFLEDDDSSDIAEHRFGHQEWDRLEENFVNAGYREGITAGKEEALQEGFDAGFEEFGAPLGREIGTLRGICAALLVALDRDEFASPSAPKPTPDSPPPSTTTATAVTEASGSSAPLTSSGTSRGDRDTLKTEVQSLIKEFATIKMSNLLPPDVEAMDHAKEHAAQAAAGGGQDGSSSRADQTQTEIFSDDIDADKATAIWKENRASFEALKERMRELLKTLGIGDLDV